MQFDVLFGLGNCELLKNREWLCYSIEIEWIKDEGGDELYSNNFKGKLEQVSVQLPVDVIPKMLQDLGSQEAIEDAFCAYEGSNLLRRGLSKVFVYVGIGTESSDDPYSSAWWFYVDGLIGISIERESADYDIPIFNDFIPAAKQQTEVEEDS